MTGVQWAVLHLLCLVPSTVLAWDIVVAGGNHLDRMSASGELDPVQILPSQLNSLTALAMAPQHDKLFVATDNKSSAASVLEINLHSGEVRPVIPRQENGMEVKGLAFDPLSNTLFWTTGHGHSILKTRLDGQADFQKRIVQRIHEFHGEVPKGIAVDSCGRYLFWTNVKHGMPSIERSNLDGSDRRVIISKDLFQPVGLAVDQAERKLYWSQELEGVEFSIERSDLDGSNREIIVNARNHQPSDLTVGADFVYWIDWVHNAVWRAPKAPQTDGVIQVHKALNWEPMGVVAKVDGEARTDAECRTIISNYEERRESASTIATTAVSDVVTESDWNEETSADGFCLNDGAVLKTKDHGPVCRCLPGFTGVRCEIEICFNYCIHGTCKVENRGMATCHCDSGFEGLRCERNVCDGFCLNGGRCYIGPEGNQSCECLSSYRGKRCEVASSLDKLCQFYCESELAVVPLLTGSGNGATKPLCSCSPNSKDQYVMDNLNASALLMPSHVPFNDDGKLFSQAGIAVTVALSCVCLLLLIAVVFLGHRVLILRKRPRIKKRFIGSKTMTPTPLTNRPSPITDQCEINIENCCNMNICETPCFEPNLRTSRPGSKREEKKTLLESMENNQDGPADDMY